MVRCAVNGALGCWSDISVNAEREVVWAQIP